MFSPSPLVHVPLDLVERPRAHDRARELAAGASELSQELAAACLPRFGAGVPIPVVVVDEPWMDVLHPLEAATANASACPPKVSRSAENRRTAWFAASCVVILTGPLGETLVRECPGLHPGGVVVVLCRPRIERLRQLVVDDVEWLDEPRLVELLLRKAVVQRDLGGEFQGPLASPARLAAAERGLRQILTREKRSDLRAIHDLVMTGKRAEVSPPENSSIRPWPTRLTLMTHGLPFDAVACPDDGLFEGLATRLRAAGMRLRFLRGTPPAQQEPRRGLPAELIDLSDVRDAIGDRMPWTDGDPLGLFVPLGAAGDFPPGIHLFMDSIKTEVSKSQTQGIEITVDLLLWAVFWHELTHASVAEVHGRLPSLPLALRPIDLEEMLCEYAALQALNTGTHPWTTVLGPKFRDAWRLEEWRTRRPLAPYSLFMNAAPHFQRSGAELSMAFVGAFRAEAEAAFEDVARGRRVARLAADLAGAKLTAQTGAAFVKHFVEKARPKPGPGRPARDNPVYLWNAR